MSAPRPNAGNSALPAKAPETRKPSSAARLGRGTSHLSRDQSADGAERVRPHPGCWACERAMLQSLMVSFGAHQDGLPDPWSVTRRPAWPEPAPLIAI
jgi:hypothetical protein